MKKAMYLVAAIGLIVTISSCGHTTCAAYGGQSNMSKKEVKKENKKETVKKVY